MARIKLEIPPLLLASIHLPVRISDINYGNHVGNDAFVSLLHEARVQWLHQLGYTELNAAGVALIMSDLAVEFRQEGFYGDQLTITVHAGECSRVGFELYYRITARRHEHNIVLAHAKTGMVCFDYSNKKPLAVPAALRQILSADS